MGQTGARESSGGAVSTQRARVPHPTQPQPQPQQPRPKAMALETGALHSGQDCRAPRPWPAARKGISESARSWQRAWHEGKADHRECIALDGPSIGTVRLRRLGSPVKSGAGTPAARRAANLVLQLRIKMFLSVRHCCTFYGSSAPRHATQRAAADPCGLGPRSWPLGASPMRTHGGRVIGRSAPWSSLER